MPSFQFTPRSYLHFDQPINAVAAEAIVTDPGAVGRHAFHPFIQYTVVTQKIRKKKGGGVELRPKKERPIAYASHVDSHIFGHYSAILMERYALELSLGNLTKTVTAFRPINRQNNIHFANEVFEFIRARSSCAVLAADISDYFGTIKHDVLKLAWCSLLRVNRLPEDHFQVFRAVTQYAVVNRERLCQALDLDAKAPRADGRRRYCTPDQFRRVVRGGGLIAVNRSGVGIPQGSPISALLSNIYLLNFDATLQALTSEHGGLYRRYCDDVLIVMPTTELRKEAEHVMRSMLSDLGLVAHPEKTELIDFTLSNARSVTTKPLNYLGFTFDGQFKRLRPASVARFYKKMKAGVGRAKALRFRASSRTGQRVPLRRRQLYLRYSYVGHRNFISYALRAAEIMKDSGIKKQVKPHWKKLQTEITK